MVGSAAKALTTFRVPVGLLGGSATLVAFGALLVTDQIPPALIYFLQLFLTV